VSGGEGEALQGARCVWCGVWVRFGVPEPVPTACPLHPMGKGGRHAYTHDLEKMKQAK
jgi:hypothetical protein